MPAEPGVHLIHAVRAERLALAVDVTNELVGDRRRSRFGRALLHASGFFDQVAARVDVERTRRARIGAIGVGGIRARRVGDARNLPPSAVDVEREGIAEERRAQQRDRRGCAHRRGDQRRDCLGRGAAPDPYFDIRRLGMAFAGALDERAREPVVVRDADCDIIQRDVAARRKRSNAAVKVALHAGVEEAEWKRREVGAAQMLALVRRQPPGACVRALGNHRFLLVARHLPGLDFDHVASAREKRRAPAAVPEPKCQRIAVHVDRSGQRRVHVAVFSAFYSVTLSSGEMA